VSELVYLHWYLPEIPGVPRTYTSSISASDWNEDPKNRPVYMRCLRDGLIAQVAHQYDATLHPHEISCAVITPDRLWNFDQDTTR
jgi:hypothetical protein